MKRLALIGLSVLTAASLSMAQEEHAKKGDKGAAKDPAARKADAAERFKKMDTNGDGKLSLDEFKAAMTKLPAADAEKKFTDADTDKDGALTPDELKNAARSGHEKHGEKRGDKGAPKADAPAAPAP